MASGKQSKRRRQELRAKPSTPRAPRTGGSRSASPKVLLGAGLAIAAIVVAVVVIVLTGGKSSSSGVPARGSLTNALPGAADVQSLFRGIPQHGNVLGSPDAPVTMIEYVDLQCPYCRDFETEAMPALVSRFVRTGKVRVEARLLAFIGPESERGRLATLAAGAQGRLFNVMALLYFSQGTENTGWLSSDLITSAAASVPGLDVPAVLDQSKAAAVKEEAAGYDTAATAARVDSTPTIFVGKSSGTPQRVTLASPTDGQAVADAIQAALSS